MKNLTKKKNGQVIFLPHGGGPIPVLGGMGHENLIAFLKGLPLELSVPDEILVISAHWEEQIPSVTKTSEHNLYYDYFGFPDAAYQFQYPVKGNPELADKVLRLLDENSIIARAEDKRGLDHGVFIPLMLSYPEAGIPVTQLSLIKGLNPKKHVALGIALRPLLERNILIIGSGFSFHNPNAFMLNEEIQEDTDNNVFQDWLIDVCCGDHDELSRERKLVDWISAPGARYCHPREEHLIPLHVCQGIANCSAKVIFDDYVVGKRCLAFYW